MSTRPNEAADLSPQTNLYDSNDQPWIPLYQRRRTLYILCLPGISRHFPERTECDSDSHIQPFIQTIWVAFIGDGTLILQITKRLLTGNAESIKNFCLDTRTNHLFHQFLIAVLLLIAMSTDTIARVMRFINNNQVIVKLLQLRWLKSKTLDIPSLQERTVWNRIS